MWRVLKRKYRMNATMNNECIRVSYSDGYINSLLNTKFLLWQWALKHLAHDTHGKSRPPQKKVLKAMTPFSQKFKTLLRLLWNNKLLLDMVLVKYVKRC